MRLFSLVKELLFPSKCILCGKLLEKNELDLCASCRIDSPECAVSNSRIPFIASWIAVWRYEGNVRQSLLRYKFCRKRIYAPGYGRLLAMKILREQEDRFDLITWVPVSRWRKLQRGYDQVALLAFSVGLELGLQPIRCLKKVRHNPPQSRMDGQPQRRANVLGVYEAVHPEVFDGKRILLLNDIITTGSTLSECARVLLTAGAKEVHCAAIAAAKHNK